MSSSLATFDLLNHETGEVRCLDLLEGLTRQHLAFVSNEWSPRLKASRDRAVIAFGALPEKKRNEQMWQEMQGVFGAPDAHWDWDKKSQTMMGSVHRMLGLVDGDLVEALMRLDLSKPSRLQVASFTPIVYVDYLAVAPWNRRQIQPKPRFTGLGTLLLGVAVTLSMEEGMEGRCGLHSLLQSESFYERAGMQDFGLDGVEQLKYFEFSPDAAKKFLET